PRLGEIVAERLNTCGADPGDAQWGAKKLGDGSWQVQLAFISAGRLHVAEWMFDPRRRHVLPVDDNAARMSLPGAEPPLPAAPPPGEATVTHLAPRLSTAAGHGGPGQGGPGLGAPGYGGAVGNGGMGNGGRARHERPGGGRPAVPEPGGLGPAAAEPRAHEAAKAEAPPAAHAASDVPPANPANPVGPVGQAPRAPRVPNAPEPGRGDPGRVTQPGRGAQAGAGPRAGAAPQSRAVPQSGAVPQAARDHRDAHARPESATAAAAPRRGEAEVPAGLESAASSSAEAVTATPGSSAEAASEQAARPARKAARGRRSSVPSWDEIMFGNSRQRD
ncbi:MAG: DUF3071 domain-containing protein, partial [Actinobacteria bacterium]|nr:DUF3071 domain-containing protein [Actinomycetota bacterium]